MGSSLAPPTGYNLNGGLGNTNSGRSAAGAGDVDGDGFLDLIAGALDAVALAMPHVPIGSYPNFDKSLGYKVKVTVEHPEAAPVSEALKRLEEKLPPGCILRRE